MQYLVKTLAGSDIHIASYYLRRGAYIAAVNRSKNILLNYPQSPYTRNALEIMVQAYDAMGMKELSDDAKRTLSLNVAIDGHPTEQIEASKRNHVWWRFWE